MRFLNIINGVSSKYLNNYLSWNNVVEHKRGSLMEITEDSFVEVQKDEKHLFEIIVSLYNISRAIKKVMSNGT